MPKAYDDQDYIDLDDFIIDNEFNILSVSDFHSVINYDLLSYRLPYQFVDFKNIYDKSLPKKEMKRQLKKSSTKVYLAVSNSKVLVYDGFPYKPSLL